MANCAKILKSEESIAIMSLLPCEGRPRAEELSLFDRFSLICDSFYLLEQNKLGLAFISALCDDLKTRVLPSALGNAEIRKEVWRAIFDSEYCGDLSYLLKSGAEDADRHSELCIAEARETTDVYGFIANFGGSLEDASRELSKEEAICADLGSLVYFRPDVYHCEESYLKLGRGEALGVDEKSALIFWVICRYLMKRKQSAELYVRVSDNLSTLAGLLALMEQRKLFPKITLEISREDVGKVSSFVTNASKKNIFISLSKEAESDLSRWLFELPKNRISLAR